MSLLTQSLGQLFGKNPIKPDPSEFSEAASKLHEEHRRGAHQRGSQTAVSPVAQGIATGHVVGHFADQDRAGKRRQHFQ